MWWRASVGRMPRSNDRSRGFVVDRGQLRKLEKEDAIVVGKVWTEGAL